MILTSRLTPPDLFRALNDPARWIIVGEMSRVEEIGWDALDALLPIKRTTVAFHLRVLLDADLGEVRKRGRARYYALRRDTFVTLLSDVLRQTRQTDDGTELVS